MENYSKNNFVSLLWYTYGFIGTGGEQPEDSFTITGIGIDISENMCTLCIHVTILKILYTSEVG